MLDAAHRAALLGREVAAAPARLEGYERRRGRYFYIVARAGVETAGVVLSGLGERDFAVLDRYEEVPRLYTRVKIEVADGWRRGASMLGLPAHAGAARTRNLSARAALRL